MKLHSRAAVTVLALLVAWASLAGCDGDGAIKVAILVPIEGGLSELGSSVQRGVTLALEEWNGRGGVNGRMFEWTVADTGCDPEIAHHAATSVLDDEGVAFIIGGACSGSAIAISEVATSRDIPFISPTGASPLVTLYEDGRTRPNAFRIGFFSPYQGVTLARLALDGLGATTAGVMLDTCDVGSRELAEYFRNAFESGGGKIVVWESFSKDDSDYSVILSKITERNPAVLVVPTYYDRAGMIGAQAREAGVGSVLIGGDGWDNAALDRGALEGSCFFSAFAPLDLDPRQEEWVARYQARFGELPDGAAALSYDAANALAQAIVDAGDARPQRVSAALEQLDLEGVTGPIRFDARHGVSRKAITVCIEGGQVVPPGMPSATPPATPR